MSGIKLFSVSPELRERFVYSYRLIYRVEASRILILAIMHGKRLLDDGIARRR